MRVGQFEPHDADRQAILLSRAKQRCAEIVAAVNPMVILLSGSVARGPVGPASDMDLHAVLEAGVEAPPVWQFSADGIIENVHTVRPGVIREGISYVGDDRASGLWFQRTALGDELSGSEVLYVREDASQLAADIGQLLALRTNTRIASIIAAVHARTATELARRAEVCSRPFPLEAHQLLRRASQSLLVGALVAAGWFIRGAKKRPEIAALYDEFEGVRRALAILLELNGLLASNPERARFLCRQRLSLRRRTVEELARLRSVDLPRPANERVEADLALYERHNAHASDYYAPLIDVGCHQGVTNHIRSLSGFGILPSSFLTCLGTAPPVVDAFLTNPLISADFRAEWSAIAALADDIDVGDWCRRITEEATRLEP